MCYSMALCKNIILSGKLIKLICVNNYKLYKIYYRKTKVEYNRKVNISKNKILFF